MKIKFLIFLVAATTVLFSCSTDSDDDGMSGGDEVSNLVGEWNLTEVNFDGQSNIELNLAAEIIDQLAEEQCYLLTFNFNADGTATATDKSDYVEINATPTGLDVPCPDQSDTETATWSLNGNQLTLISTDMEEETIEINLDGNTMIIAGDDIDPDNYPGAQAIFTRS